MEEESRRLNLLGRTYTWKARVYLSSELARFLLSVLALLVAILAIGSDSGDLAKWKYYLLSLASAAGLFAALSILSNKQGRKYSRKYFRLLHKHEFRKLNHSIDIGD